MIDAFASEPQYVEHILPIWQALPPKLRGTFFVQPSLSRHARRFGLPVRLAVRPSGSGPIITASFNDEIAARHRPVIFVEHGAGQHYGGNFPGYSGGAKRDAVRLFICPNETVARRNADVYPDALTAVVGCPKLDAWHDGRRPTGVGTGPTVAVSFHWDCHVQPESRSAFGHYSTWLPTLAEHVTSLGGRLIGHAHPRAASMLRGRYQRAGIDFEPNFDAVLDRADLFICDNSSALYEFASTGRPVLVLNAPWYRREIEHGLRFWEFADVGVQVDEPEDLTVGVDVALSDPPDVAARRAEIVSAVYAVRDGSAARHAATAIVSALDHGRLEPAPARRPDPYGSRRSDFAAERRSPARR